MEMKFQCGDQVRYGSHGLCHIIGIEKMKSRSGYASYFVLQPCIQSDSRYYVPVHNEAAVSKLSKALTKDEVCLLLTRAAGTQDQWIDDEMLRKQKYKELITGNDREALLNMVRSVFTYRTGQLAAGKRLHLSDEGFLKDAQRLLEDEFAAALAIDKSEGGAVIESYFK